MYCLQLTIKPTAAMTFRMIPGSILNIATYPFVPPTSLSGFLRRLTMMKAGLDIPETKVNKEKPPTYLLPPDYITLGAYPDLSEWTGIHRTYRKGMQEFNHDDFSKLVIKGKGKNFQLHTWEYFFTEQLSGFVISQSAKKLEALRAVEGFGCYIGKEGYAYVEKASEVIEMIEEECAATPSTVVPADDLIQNSQWYGGCDIYNLYHYRWQKEAYAQLEETGVWGEEPTAVDGFIPFTGAYYSDSANHPILNYWTDQENIFIPSSLVSLLSRNDPS
ncbi:hypothetical protein AWQ24_15205 (plasmid) [Picosynechococcus sp. PCC 8807]|nr:hypothetical protein AWQ23_15600 [Picosynechococcus sp. PCC 73109]ANV92124.1 hypothetical protein AWQ24_15205 [Picosynechococcus sp. PCC 8807]